MQLRRAPYHAVFEIGNDDRAVVGAFRGIAFDEAVIHEALEAVMTAYVIEPQQMIAQQRQFFLLAQGPNGALDADRRGDGLKTGNE